MFDNIGRGVGEEGDLKNGVGDPGVVEEEEGTLTEGIDGVMKVKDTFNEVSGGDGTWRKI